MLGQGSRYSHKEARKRQVHNQRKRPARTQHKNTRRKTTRFPTPTIHWSCSIPRNAPTPCRRQHLRLPILHRLDFRLAAWSNGLRTTPDNHRHSRKPRMDNKWSQRTAVSPKRSPSASREDNATGGEQKFEKTIWAKKPPDSPGKSNMETMCCEDGSNLPVDSTNSLVWPSLIIHHISQFARLTRASTGKTSLFYSQVAQVSSKPSPR